MNTRILTPILVFVFGFGIGYGLTWVLVGDEGISDPIGVAAAAPADPSARDGEGPPVLPAAALAVPAPPTPEVALAPEVAVGDVPVAADPEAAPVAAVGKSAEVAAAPEVLAEPKPWWETCRNTVCRIDWGGISGGMSVRKGSIEHGSEVSWDKRFASARRRLIVPTDDARQKVTLLNIGLDANGVPSVAHLRLRSAGESVEGVVKLVVGGKHVTLVPTL